MKAQRIAEGLKHWNLLLSFVKRKTIEPFWSCTRMGYFPELVSKEVAQMTKFGNLMRRCRAKTIYMRTLGARVLENSEITGRINVDNPRHIQVNSFCRIKNLTVSGDAYVLVDNKQNLDDVLAEKDTILAKGEVIKGRRVSKPFLTFSIDLESGVGLAHSSKISELVKNPKAWNYIKDSATKLLSLFSHYEIPVTWFACGHLFLEKCNGKHPFDEKEWYGDWFRYDPATSYLENNTWYLPDVIGIILDNDLFELGYHSFGHFNYIESSDKTIIKDMEIAKKIRKDLGVKLNSFSYPWNEVSRLCLLQEGGFRNVRGWIGTTEAKGITAFAESIRFFHTSAFLHPKIDISSFIRKCIDQSTVGPFNVFTHPHSWVTPEEFSRLSLLLSQIHELRETEEILIQRLDKV